MVADKDSTHDANDAAVVVGSNIVGEVRELVKYTDCCWKLAVKSALDRFLETRLMQSCLVEHQELKLLGDHAYEGTGRVLVVNGFVQRDRICYTRPCQG
jgi:hypothetical protein